MDYSRKLTTFLCVIVGIVILYITSINMIMCRSIKNAYKNQLEMEVQNEIFE